VGTKPVIASLWELVECGVSSIAAEFFVIIWAPADKFARLMRASINTDFPAGSAFRFQAAR
jgi:hypothetical protein